MAAIKEEYWVTKRNVINEMRAKMTLQELRFLAIYLCKIDKDHPDETRRVRFPLEDFRAIMKLEQPGKKLNRLNVKQLKATTNGLLCKVVNVPVGDHGGYKGFQLFKECEVNRDITGAWYVEIDAHDLALPMMFSYKNEYVRYRVWNVLRLKSNNQIRLYELLKQYENTKQKARVVTVDELKMMIGMDKDEYPRFGDFKYRVLDPCQKALAETTDIKFTYEPHGKKGRGGKILALKFNIEENKDYFGQMVLAEIIDDWRLEQTEPKQGEVEVVDADEFKIAEDPYKKRIDFLMGACKDEFTFAEVDLLYSIMREQIEPSKLTDDLHCYDYLAKRYKEMNTRKNVKHRFAYLKRLMEEPG